MYTLEDVVDRNLYIHCPERWQRDVMVDYAQSELNDNVWGSVDYHQYHEMTYFEMCEMEPGVYEMFYRCLEVFDAPEKNKIISFDEFCRNTKQIDIEIFENFLMEG